jgi:peroxiredoxin
MRATLFLLGSVLAAGQTTDRTPPSPARGGDWLVMTRLNRGQELVYRGTFSEDASGGRVEFSRAARFESRLFVLDTPARGAEVVFLTVFKPREQQAGAATPISVRLERALVDLQGKLTPSAGVNPTAPLDGMPSWECGAFLEIPKGRLTSDQTWETAEEGRPSRVWRVAGTETVNGTSCVKLFGVQQTEDWEKPRADHSAWRRQDTVWLAPRAGYAYRVERIIERRGPAQRSVLRYELESSLQYPGQLYDDRRQEIVQASAFQEVAAPLLPVPAKTGSQLEALHNKIAHHVENQPATPYREAVLLVKRRVEAARRGETPPAPPTESAAAAVASVANVGEGAPDFAAPDLIDGGSVGLRRFAGRPALFVFYHPASSTAGDLLRFAQRVSNTYPKSVTVVGMSVSEDAATVRRQRAELNLTFPVLNGSGLRISYAVETTPKIVLIDAAGVVRGTYIGWGRETPGEVMEELRRWLAER